MERTEIEVDRTEIEKLLHDELERARLLYDAEEKNFRRFADFIIHGVVLDDLKGTDTIADALYAVTMKAAFEVSEQHVERFRQASVKIRECLSAVEEQLPPDAGVWREAAITSLLQAYGATIAAIEVNVAAHDIKRTSSSKTAKGASHG